VRFFGAASILFALLIPTASASAPLEPKGKWIVDFDDAQCVASREFGTPTLPLTLVLKRPPIGDIVQLSLFAPRDRSRRIGQLQVELRADEQPIDRSTMLAYDPDGSSRRVYRLNLSGEQVAALHSASSVNLAGENEIQVRLANPQIETALRVLDACVTDLRERWNIGLDGRSAGLRRRATTTGFDYLFTSRDLPRVGIGSLQQGDVGFVLLIDEAGKIADCSITKTSRYALLDAQSCAIPTGRARFKPAVGSDGKPARDFYSYTVEWRLGMEVKNQ
jgi:hypothetical protein